MCCVLCVGVCVVCCVLCVVRCVARCALCVVCCVFVVFDGCVLFVVSGSVFGSLFVFC